MRASIKVRVTGVQDVYAYLNKVGEKLSEPRGGLERATTEIGRYWRQNFDAEGAIAQSWPNLAQHTIEERLRQGYGAGPIMQRARGLYRVAGQMVEGANAGSVSYSTPYDPRNGHSIRGTVAYEKRSVTVTAEGPQVFNNWVGKYRPARPFWPVNARAGERARYGVWTWLLDEVLS